MTNNIDNREFEQFLKENANQYRMYPSEKVWIGIHNTIHTRRRWFGIGLTLLITTVASVTWLMLSTPSSNIQLNTISSENKESSISESKPISQFISPVAKKVNNSVPYLSFLNISSEEATSEETLIASENISQENILQEEAVVIVKKPIAENNTTKKPLADEKSANQSELIQIAALFTDQNNESQLPAPVKSPRNHGAGKPLFKEILPWSIENALNSYKVPAKKKLAIQLYVAPTISYRKLSENKSFLSSATVNSNSNLGRYDVNKLVTHKPAIGLELGLAAKYPVTKRIKVRGGIQFNISRYDIKAFNYNGEVAIIALDDGPGVNSVYRWTKYRNFDGYSSNWLQNYYFSVSAPFGAEIQIAKNKKTSFGIAGTIQPTFVLRDEAYLLSTDFKNYAQVPWLIRPWNVNTSFETFVNYSTGRIKWQAGPQVRYQLMSSFLDKYPVKENLFDFGLKVGIMLNQ